MDPFMLFPHNPSLGGEFERLFHRDERTESRSRLGSSGSEHESDDFTTNGVDSDLDELDKILRGMSFLDTIATATGAGNRSRNPSGSSGGSSLEDDVLTKESLLELYRIRTRSRVASTQAARSRRVGGFGGGVVCVFCRNNGESSDVYSSHYLKDQSGRVTCPVLRAYTCPICHSSGDNAHTIKYCPLSSGDTLISSLKTARTSTGKKRQMPLPR